MKTIIYILFTLSLSSIVKGQVIKTRVSKINQQSQPLLSYDTSKTAIIKSKWGFDSSYTPTYLTQKELLKLDNLYSTCIANNTNRLGKRTYRRQLVVAKNKFGEKEVWVNCFCGTGGDNWRNEIIVVFDGGSCYFNLKINLTTNKFYDLIINGLG
jgi:hypothetical protein